MSNVGSARLAASRSRLATSLARLRPKAGLSSSQSGGSRLAKIESQEFVIGTSLIIDFTERAFSGEYDKLKNVKGVFRCICCDTSGIVAVAAAPEASAALGTRAEPPVGADTDGRVWSANPRVAAS